jgi:hypothetical protein
MAAWTNDELAKLGKVEELRIATLSRDGTLHNRVMIWMVRVGDDLYECLQRAARGMVPRSTAASFIRFSTRQEK